MWGTNTSLEHRKSVQSENDDHFTFEYSVLCREYDYRMILWALFCLALMLIGSLESHAQKISEESRPALGEVFGTGELTLTTGAILGLGLLSVWGEEWIGPKGSSMGIPSEGSVDLRFSRWSNPHFDPKAQWLGGTPDLAGYAAPVLGLAYYIGGSVLGERGQAYGAHPHEAIAFTQGLSWAMFTTTLLKRIVGRERPYIARGKLNELDASAVEMSRSEQLLSFPSGHSTAIAATSFFVAADLSDALVSGPLRSRSAFEQAFLGRVLPYLTASGLSWMVMYSRIKDQRHWLSDTLTGATIGAFSALLSYHMHFDRQGAPRER